MGKCASCGQTIFGGVKDGERRFCNARCRNNGRIVAVAAVVPDDVVEALGTQMHSGPCPKCKGPGPVDVHFSYRVWSAFIVTRRISSSQISCRRCGLKTQTGNLIFSTLFGWWGLPWGLVFTPVQVCRNIAAMVSPPDPAAPSAELMRRARIELAARVQQ